MFEKMFTRCNPLLNEWHQRSSVTARYFEDERVIRGRVDATIHPSLRHRTSMAVGSALSGRIEAHLSAQRAPDHQSGKDWSGANRYTSPCAC